MKYLLILILNLTIAHANTNNFESFENARREFTRGNYSATVVELEKIQENLKFHNQLSKEAVGLINYWAAISYNRLLEYDKSIQYFKKAIQLEYVPIDLPYEYAQALFAAEKYIEARIQFRESVKKKFKRAVSLYYIGFISKELGEHNKAFKFLSSIKKLEDEDIDSINQAAQMIIGDMFYEQAEKKQFSFKVIDEKVIPQYKNAYMIDTESNLAEVISKKIKKIQRKYDLLLFELRNGRPTLIPPYFLRASEEIGLDTNVTFSPANTTIEKSKQSSIYSKTDLLGRYTFYYRDYMSFSPEVRFINMYHFNRVPEIYRNDNYLLSTAVRTSYEHSYEKNPASFLLDYEFSEARRDVNENHSFAFNFRTNSLVFGERLTLSKWGESTFRLRYRNLESYVEGSNSTLVSLSYEQFLNFMKATFVLYLSYDMTKVENDLYDNNAVSIRVDGIFIPVFWGVTPSIGIGLTTTDPVNGKSQRGIETLLNPSIRLTKTLKKNWRLNLKYDYQDYVSKDKDNFAYKKSLTALELEYLF